MTRASSWRSGRCDRTGRSAQIPPATFRSRRSSVRCIGGWIVHVNPSGRTVDYGGIFHVAVLVGSASKALDYYTSVPGMSHDPCDTSPSSAIVRIGAQSIHLLERPNPLHVDPECNMSAGNWRGRRRSTSRSGVPINPGFGGTGSRRGLRFRRRLGGGSTGGGKSQHERKAGGREGLLHAGGRVQRDGRKLNF